MFVIFGTASGLTLWFAIAVMSGWSNPLLLKIIIGAIVFMVSLIPGWIFSAIISAFFHKEEVLKEDSEVVNLSGKSSMSGSFFLACGDFGEKGQYHFYRKLQSGGFVGEELPISADITIFETTEHGGKFRKYVQCFTHPYAAWFVWDVEDDENPRYEFDIPKGGIRREITLA